MNWLKKVATAPVTFARNTVRVIKARDAAVDVIELADDAAQNPKLYQDASWWSRLFTASGRLAALIPIAPEVRTSMKNTGLKITALIGLLVTVISQIDPAVLQSLLPMIPEAYRPIVMAIVAAATAAAAYAHPAPGQEKK